VRPIFTFRWAFPIVLLAAAAGELLGAYQNLIHQEIGGVWFLGGGAVLWIALALFCLTAYIRVDDSRIVFGPKVLHRTFDRREVAGIRATASPMTRRTFLLRSDGSTLWGTAGFFWGRDGLQSLANYLGVPFEGWDAT